MLQLSKIGILLPVPQLLLLFFSPQAYEVRKANIIYISQVGKSRHCYWAGQLVEEEGQQRFVAPYDYSWSGPPLAFHRQELEPLHPSISICLKPVHQCPSCWPTWEEVWILATELLSSRLSYSSYLYWASEQVALPKATLLALFKPFKGNLKKRWWDFLQARSLAKIHSPPSTANGLQRSDYL